MTSYHFNEKKHHALNIFDKNTKWLLLEVRVLGSFLSCLFALLLIVMQLCTFIYLVCTIEVALCFIFIPHKVCHQQKIFRSDLRARKGAESDSEPSSPLIGRSFASDAINLAKASAVTTGLASLSGRAVKPAGAIGSLYEFQEQSCLIQDVSFNVPNAMRDAQMFKLYSRKRVSLREDETVSTISFRT